MKLKFVAAALASAALALPAADPSGFTIWKSTELKAFAKTLSPKINDKKVATQELAATGNYSFMVAHREGSGEAEYHETKADIFVVQSGQATLIYGGKMVDAKTTAPNEMRAPSITGGMETKLGPGDIVTIPPKLPHQVKLDGSKEFTYFVVKVNQ